RVATDATKREIAKAVEKLFEVQVDSVQVVNVKGKQKRFGNIQGKRSDWKKAYVRLKPGSEIDFAAGA
ncbi:MAG: 50S ribosomal protein L23, partial [Candidatus Thiodiazotropha sp. (ex Notomyrtea botanica)]|nr:50S ribosomal protein L23 [Candidatus Thiodiazotropha sp. (ex Notomyrtea botanica)]